MKTPSSQSSYTNRRYKYTIILSDIVINNINLIMFLKHTKFPLGEPPFCIVWGSRRSHVSSLRAVSWQRKLWAHPRFRNEYRSAVRIWIFTSRRCAFIAATRLHLSKRQTASLAIMSVLEYTTGLFQSCVATELSPNFTDELDCSSLIYRGFWHWLTTVLQTQLHPQVNVRL